MARSGCSVRNRAHHPVSMIANNMTATAIAIAVNPPLKRKRSLLSRRNTHTVTNTSEIHASGTSTRLAGTIPRTHRYAASAPRPTRRHVRRCGSRAGSDARHR